MSKNKTTKRRVALMVMPSNAKRSRVTKTRKRRSRTSKGLLANLGNMLLPGIGGAIGQFGDNAFNGVVGGLLGGRSNSVPVAGAGRNASRQINTSTEYGTEKIATITVPAGTAGGSILLQRLLAAPELGVRLASFAKLWTKTKFMHFAVSVSSSNPSTTPGNYTTAIDPDPCQNYNSGTGLPDRLMALTTCRQTNAWANTVISMKPNPLALYNKFSFEGSSDAEIREYACGQLIICTTTDFSEEATFTVDIDWHVQFERPDTAGDEIPRPIIILSTLGQQFTSPKNNTFSLPSANIWSNIPPFGIYNVPRLENLQIECSSATVANKSYNLLQFTVKDDDTTTILSSNFSFPPEDLVTITAQRPFSYVLNINAPRVGSLGLAGSISRYYANPAHVAWQQYSEKRALDRKTLRAMEDTLAARLASACAYMNDDDFQNELLKLRESNRDSGPSFIPAAPQATGTYPMCH